VGENLPETGQVRVTSAAQPIAVSAPTSANSNPGWSGGDTGDYEDFSVLGDDTTVSTAHVVGDDDHPSSGADFSSFHGGCLSASHPSCVSLHSDSSCLSATLLGSTVVGESKGCDSEC